MTKIIMSGYLFMQQGNSEWLKRYLVMAGLSIAWFLHRLEFKHKSQPLGSMPLSGCVVKDIPHRENRFSLIVHHSNGMQSKFKFKTETRKQCSRWMKQLKTAIEECNVLKTSSMPTEQARTFGVYKNSLSFLSALQSGAIVMEDESDDIDGQSGSISSISNADMDLPTFYSKLQKRRKVEYERQPTLSRSVSIQPLQSQRMSVQTTQSRRESKSGRSRHRSLRKSMAMSTSSGSSSVDLLRRSIAAEHINLHDIELKDNSAEENEDKHLADSNVIRAGLLFYSCGNETKTVHVRLYKEIMHHFEDEECTEKVGEIDLRLITNVKYVDQDTFELHTVIHDKIHVFSMYDGHEAESWVDEIASKCNIRRINAESMDESYDATYSDDNSMINATQPVLVSDTSWYSYLCCCCCTKTQEVVVHR